MTFNRIVWGEMGRRDVKINVVFKTVIAGAAKKALLPHLRVKGRQFIVFTNEAARARENILNYARVAMRDAKTAGDVLEIEGKNGIAWKSLVVDSFAGHLPASHLDVINVVGVAATAAASCGLSSSRVGVVVREGIPATAIDLEQERGRAGRGRVPQGPGAALDNLYHIIVSLGSVTFMLQRIALSDTDQEQTCQTKEYFEVLRLVVLPTECFHVRLEELFSSPRGTAVERAPCEVLRNCNCNCNAIVAIMTL